MLAIKSDTRYRFKTKESNTQRFGKKSIKMVKESKLFFCHVSLLNLFLIFSSTILLFLFLNSLLHNFNIFPQFFNSLHHIFFIIFPPQCFFIPLLHLLIILYIFPSTNTSSSFDTTSTQHRSHIDITWTLHWPLIDPTLTLHSTFF